MALMNTVINLRVLQKWFLKPAEKIQLSDLRVLDSAD
jgi:hypothetical protein